MKFENASTVEQIVWQMRLADYPRAINRARINNLFNGAPPYTPDEEEENNINTNVNDLSSTNQSLISRRQFNNAFCSPDPLFTINLDYGPPWKRREWADKIQKRINKKLLDSPQFLELRDGLFASVVLHGIGPTGWPNKKSWLGKQYGVEDVLFPSNTLRSLENLPFFAIYRSYTVNQIITMTRGPVVDKGWQKGTVDAAIKWADSAATQLLGTTWPEVWSPEKMEERFKQDGGLYASDAVPTLDCYDFYFWDDNGKSCGWKRRIILDAWGQPGVSGITPINHIKEPGVRRKSMEFSKGNFLYTSGDRIYADSLDKILHFQFGDASSISPFRYHSVRGLGFLLFAVCHLQNRLKCRFNDAVFESLMQYFRVANPNDVDRTLKVDLVDRGFLTEGLEFVKQGERWQYDKALASEAIAMNDRSIQTQSGPYVQDYQPEQSDESATLTMARVNSTASIVGSVLNMGYMRERFRYMEICRRYCIKNSQDKDVREVRKLLLAEDGVPEEALDVNRWDIQVTRVMGGGNRMLEVAIAEKLMAVRAAHGPEGQQQIIRLYDAAVSGDYSLAESLNPIVPHISDSVHDSEMTFGALMAGSNVTPRPGLNPIEVIETMLKLIDSKIQEITQSGGVGQPSDVMGLDRAAKYTAGFIQQMAMDKDQKARVKQYNDALGKMMNEVKAFAQRLQEQAQKAQQNGNMSPEDQAIVLTAKTKSDLAKQSHAQKTAQRQIQFEQKIQQDKQKHALDLQTNAAQAAIDISKGRAQLFNEE